MRVNKRGKCALVLSHYSRVMINVQCNTEKNDGNIYEVLSILIAVILEKFNGITTARKCIISRVQ